jgi:bifunctional non-homologous end joining protein LigD
VFFDFGQNAMGKTLAAIYSTRPTPGGLVSFPIDWDDLRDVYPTDFTIATVPALLAKHGDLWKDILSHAQRIA